jgi:hypothetical protein
MEEIVTETIKDRAWKCLRAVMDPEGKEPRGRDKKPLEVFNFIAMQKYFSVKQVVEVTGIDKLEVQALVYALNKANVVTRYGPGGAWTLTDEWKKYRQQEEAKKHEEEVERKRAAHAAQRKESKPHVATEDEKLWEPVEWEETEDQDDSEGRKE